MDDVLIWAPSLQELHSRVTQVATNCEKLNIILSKKKFAIGSTLPFAGYIVSDKGVRPDPSRVEAIKKFPTPTNLTGVRSFLGLAQQFSFFIPDYSHATAAMRQLLGKEKVFRWLPEHQQEFDRVKKLLSANLLTRHFDPEKEVTLLTDASRHHGMGFALCQKENDNYVLITCGSKSFTPTQQRYATIELECLAIIWAIQKCEFFLKGLPTFTVATDHRPLVGTFSKNLAELSNPRLQRLREKVCAYSFDVTYVPGKSHSIADALSRAPIFPGSDDLDIQVDTALAHLTTARDPALSIVYEACLLYTSPSPRD